MAFLGMGRAAGPSPGSPGAVMQVIELTGIAAAKGPAGQLILDLVLLDGLHLPVTFPPAALPMIKTALAQLESSAKSGGKPPGRERH